MIRRRTPVEQPPTIFKLLVGAAVASFALVGVARANDPDSYAKVTQVDVPAVPITCNFSTPDTSFFTFDISFVGAARGEFLLADSSHGTPSSDTEGGLLKGATDGDVLLIDVDNPGAGATPILPPKNDPFAGRRCDDNTAFGGVPGNPSRNEISGPNGLFTVNDTEVWVGDGPGRFVPGQTNSAQDYAKDPCDSSVRVFSLITKEQTDHINVNGCFRTDEGGFDPVDQVALMANPSEQSSVAAINPHAKPVAHSPFLTLISTGDKHTILTQINLDGTNGTILADAGIEQAVYVRQTGLFYVAIPGTAADANDGFLVVVDPRPGHLDVVKNIPLKGCAPTGLALGPNETLLLGCGDQVYDLKTNTLMPISGVPGTSIAAACDEVTYDAGSGHYGSACITAGSKGAFDLLVADAHTNVFDLELAGASGAHSVTADPTTATFWMPMYQGACGANTACVFVYGGDDSDAQGQ